MVHGKTTFGFLPGVAFAAVFFENGYDLVDKVYFGDCRGG
jgi:hypothetical protein